MNRKFIFIPLTCVMMIGLLSGCGKKMDYDIDMLEKHFDSASEYSDIYKSKLEQAVTGNLYETVEGANNLYEEAIRQKQLEEKGKPDSEGKDSDKKSINGIVPDLVIAEKDIPDRVETKTEQSMFLQEDFEVTSYKGINTAFTEKHGGYPAWKYEKRFTGTQSKVYDDLFKLLTKVNTQYKDAEYFDNRYRKVTASNFKDIDGYINLYKVGNGRFYAVSKVNVKANFEDIQQCEGIYQLWFFDTQKHQDLKKNEYSDDMAIIVFERMLKGGNIPSDFNLYMFTYDHDNDTKMNLEDIYWEYGYGKATSPTYDGPYDIDTLEPGEKKPEPEPEVVTIPEPELIIDDLITSTDTDVEADPSVEPGLEIDGNAENTGDETIITDTDNTEPSATPNDNELDTELILE